MNSRPCPFHALQLVSKEHLVRYEALSTLMTQDDNYTNYRQELATIPPEVMCTPFIGVCNIVLLRK